MNTTALITVSPAASAGAAFLLRDRPRVRATIPLGPGECAEVNPESPYIVVRSNSFRTRPDAESAGHRQAQQALDLLAARGIANLTTARSDLECLLWWTEQGITTLAITDTVLAAWQVDAEGSVGGGSRMEAPLVQFPVHHAAFRFFRLSQATDDLFEAYRNAYLAIELLVSDLVPKQRREQERVWLNRAFDDALADTIPDDMSAGELVDALYAGARLPLFHAKRERQFSLPQDDRAERERISNALRLAVATILKLFRRFTPNTTVGGGNMSRAARHAQCVASYVASQLCLAHAEQSMKLATPYRFTSVEALRFDNPTFCLGGRVPSDKMPSFDAAYLYKDNVLWMTVELPQPVSLEGIDSVEVFVQTHQFNTREPKTVFTS